MEERGISVRHARTFGVLLGALVLLGTVRGRVGQRDADRSSRRRTDAGFDVSPERSRSPARSPRPTRRCSDAPSSTPVNVLHQVRLRRDRVLRRRRAGLRGDEPARHRQVAEGQRRAVRAYEQHTGAGLEQDQRGGREGRARREDQRDVPDGLRRRRGDGARELGRRPARRSTASPPCRRTRSSSRRPRVTPEFIGATAVWPSLGGPDHAGENVIVGVLDTGIWPEHPSFANNGLPAPPGGPYGCQFGDGSDVAHLGPTFACNRKLVGAYAFTRHLHGGASARARASTATTRREICSARDSEGHGTHTASTAAGDARRLGAALRHRPRPDQRHGARRARDHVPRLPRAGLLPAPTRSRRSSRRSTTAST